MTIENFVFIRKEDLPKPVDWAAAIQSCDFDLTLPESFEYPTERARYIQCQCEGLESGFDLVVEPYNAEEFNFTEEDLALLGDRDTMVCFSTYSNAQEIAGMVLASSALAERFEGVLLADFFEEELIPSNKAVEFANSRIEGIRGQYNGPSKIRQAMLNASKG